MEENVRTMITFVPFEQTDTEEEIQVKIMRTAESIVDNFKLTTDMFVYEKDDRNRSIFVTYKAEIPEESKQSPIPNTKFINRNAKTNTFFSINALNRICLKEIGRQDSTHKVKWDNYRNMIFLIRTNKDGEKELIENKISKYYRLSISDNGKIEVIQ